MNTTLNNYTIDDFLKLKPIIYEYCVNLTQKRTLTSWYRNLDDAKDLYQDVFLYVHKYYFNKEREAITEGRFIQRMKNCTYYAFYKRVTLKKYKVDGRLEHYQDSDITNYLFDNSRYDTINLYENIQDHPDYDFYMKGLKLTERLAIQYFMNGYTKTEVAKKFNKDYPFVTRLVNKIEANANKDKFSKPLIKEVPIIIEKKREVNDLEYLKKTIPNFKQIFNIFKGKSLKNDNKIKVYSLYKQGVRNMDIATEVNKSISQVTVEIYRINQKIKKYAK